MNKKILLSYFSLSIFGIAPMRLYDVPPADNPIIEFLKEKPIEPEKPIEKIITTPFYWTTLNEGALTNEKVSSVKTLPTSPELINAALTKPEDPNTIQMMLDSLTQSGFQGGLTGLPHLPNEGDNSYSLISTGMAYGEPGSPINLNNLLTFEIKVNDKYKAILAPLDNLLRTLNHPTDSSKYPNAAPMNIYSALTNLKEIFNNDKIRDLVSDKDKWDAIKTLINAVTLDVYEKPVENMNTQNLEPYTDIILNILKDPKIKSKTLKELIKNNKEKVFETLTNLAEEGKQYIGQAISTNDRRAQLAWECYKGSYYNSDDLKKLDQSTTDARDNAYQCLKEASHIIFQEEPTISTTGVSDIIDALFNNILPTSLSFIQDIWPKIVKGVQLDDTFIGARPITNVIVSKPEAIRRVREGVTFIEGKQQTVFTPQDMDPNDLVAITFNDLSSIQVDPAQLIKNATTPANLSKKGTNYAQLDINAALLDGTPLNEIQDPAQIAFIMKKLPQDQKEFLAKAVEDISGRKVNNIDIPWQFTNSLLSKTNNLPLDEAKQNIQYALAKQIVWANTNNT